MEERFTTPEPLATLSPLATMPPAAWPMPLTASSVTFWPAALMLASVSAPTADAFRPPSEVIEASDETLHLRSAAWAETVSGPPRTVVRVALFAPITWPAGAVSVIAPVVTAVGTETIPASVLATNSMLPLVAVTLTGSPALALTVSTMRTFEPVIVMGPLTVEAPTITIGDAAEPNVRLPGAVRFDPTRTKVPVSPGNGDVVADQTSV